MGEALRALRARSGSSRRFGGYWARHGHSARRGRIRSRARGTATKRAHERSPIPGRKLRRDCLSRVGGSGRRYDSRNDCRLDDPRKRRALRLQRRGGAGWRLCRDVGEPTRFSCRRELQGGWSARCVRSCLHWSSVASRKASAAGSFCSLRSQVSAARPESPRMPHRSLSLRRSAKVCGRSSRSGTWTS